VTIDTGALEAAGLYDPGAPDAAERLELLRYLCGRGITLEHMVSADRAGRLLTLSAEMQLRNPDETLTVEDVAARTGSTVDRVLRIRLAGGTPVDPDDPRVPVTAVGDIAAFEAGAALFGEAATLSFTRVLGGAVARIAEAAVDLFMSELSPLAVAKDAPVQVARAAADATAALMGLPPVMEHLLRDHVLMALRRTATERAPETDARAVTVGIGFVDLVGSTQWSRDLAFKDQALALGRFESEAWAIAAHHDGRVVKLIGDAAMFISPSGTAAARIALELCQAVAADGALPGARGAAGYGTVAARDGDYFGSLVNLVARAVKVADPGSVVVTGAVRDELDGAGWNLVEVPEPRLRGIGEAVRLYAVSPQTGSGTAPSSPT
jgi:class 3 adenylate cyclase